MTASGAEKLFLGIDIGSVSLGCVVIDEQQEIVHSAYVFHHGNIAYRLREQLEQIDLSRVCQVGHNRRSGDFFSEGISVNDQVAVIEGMRFQTDKVGSVFIIGGETFGLILFDENQQYEKYISNSSCAAGTGAFLDQQAERLGLSGSAELSRLADAFAGEPPKIATRCAVFAKTDLIHCQQQGYSLEAISAGLCQGLAHNIVDTLNKGVNLRPPVAVIGGVSQNRRVMRYLSEMIGAPLEIPPYPLLAGAIGCAVLAQSSRPDQPRATPLSVETLLSSQTQAKQYFFTPLAAPRSGYPDFSAGQHSVVQKVEVDVYDLPPGGGPIPVYLGLDIGSTSTKAVIMEAAPTERNLVGVYTRTMGQPIKATQDLLRVLEEIEATYGVHFDFQGVGTTGSGREFIKKVISADLAVDEITAHARAAYALNPAVDTIIEIGGQDSKFTVMRNGHVTFSVMNYVCAAGTGSFIEEQAKRLNVPLQDYARLAMGTSAPLTSDRCTVFMERDLNHFLSVGYSREELLAAALHSVADNYLSKVAHLNKIGDVVCFQGATAKNEALVAVFEQKLQKPIFVSKYCHLTGALGVCLLLREKHVPVSHFRGLDFSKQVPQVSEEICDLCKNHCKLTRVQVDNSSVLWGFLCGRDETDRGPKSANQTGFDLLSSRRRIFNPANLRPEVAEPPVEEEEETSKLLSVDLRSLNLDRSLGKLREQLNVDRSLDKLKEQLNLDRSLDKLRERLDLNVLNWRHKLFAVTQEDYQERPEKFTVTIGLPNTLYLLDYLPFWELFFRKLGYQVVVSPSRAGFMEKGKEIAGADFCAPMANWHGHVADLVSRVDYVFLPQMFQETEASQTKFYCYYSNYAAALIRNVRALEIEAKCLTPIIDFALPAIQNVQQIYASLPEAIKLLQTPGEIQEAYVQAWHWFREQKEQLARVFEQQTWQADDISVVLLGRPYLILDPVMNQQIPQKFNALGVKTFFQDMLPLADREADGPAKEFVDWNHWKYGDHILRVLEYIGKTEKLYPVYLSAFKCSPDAFVMNYFKEVLDAYQKPYLILQLDQHGSDVGYGTRVEAAVETFRNHFQGRPSARAEAVLADESQPAFKHKTILVPNFDPLVCDLVCAAMDHAGYQTRLIEETPATVVSSLRLNDGQCLPISSIVQGAVETIQKHQLQPENTALFLNAITALACNFPQYPLMAKKLLRQRGEGFEAVQIFATEFAFNGFPLELIYDIYCSYLFGGLLRKFGCKLRPYEAVAGETDRVIASALQKLHRCLADGWSKDAVFAEIVADFGRLPLLAERSPRPQVTIIGDLYVRDNPTFNQQLIAELEAYGAEVVTVPFSYVIRMLADRHNYALYKTGRYVALLRDKLLIEVFEQFERRFYQLDRKSVV
jgi:predicted CoA-substrate-specific enzyme activase